MLPFWKLIATVFLTIWYVFSMPEDTDLVPITYPKPNPCYTLERYSVEDGVLKIFLKREESDRLCIQVIVREELKLPKEVAEDINKVEVFTENKLWQAFER